MKEQKFYEFVEIKKGDSASGRIIMDDFGRSLRFKNVQIEDKGKYICKTRWGNTEGYFIFDLQVECML